ncbi:MAG: glycosyltransferase [Candidatus Aminicenantes bacterium]|nr:MAG: glycosyltransferase [Candidatus Aminicenantes bacterium]
MNRFKCVILQDIIAPYKSLLFNALEKSMGGDFKVIYFGETDRNRQWRVVKKELKFPFEVMFEGKTDEASSTKVAAETYRRLNCYDPQVVIIGGYNYFAYWAALIWARTKKRKVIVIIESHYLDKPRYILKEKVKRLFVSNCNAALVDGTRHRDYTISLGLKSESIFIKKGTGPVDVSFYQRAVSRYKNNKIDLCKKLGIPCNNFIFIGRFSPEKNIISLLRVYKKIKDEVGKGWGLILLGNGLQRKKIEDFINENAVKDILLPGFKQKEEIPFFYVISDVLILPSVSEPWGLVVAEAMASNLPVLVSNRCGCYPDIVYDGINGFSFDPFNDDQLFELMNNVTRGEYNLEDMGKASLQIIKDHTPEKAAEMYLNAINFVMIESSK